MENENVLFQQGFTQKVSSAITSKAAQSPHLMNVLLYFLWSASLYLHINATIMHATAFTSWCTSDYLSNAFHTKL